MHIKSYFKTNLWQYVRLLHVVSFFFNLAQNNINYWLFISNINDWLAII